MSLGKETRWTFESNLNLTSITNLKTDICNKHIHFNSFIHIFLRWGTRRMVDTSFSYGLSELLFEVNTLRRPTSHPPWQGRPGKFKPRKLQIFVW